MACDAEPSVTPSPDNVDEGSAIDLHPEVDSDGGSVTCLQRNGGGGGTVYLSYTGEQVGNTAILRGDMINDPACTSASVFDMHRVTDDTFSLTFYDFDNPSCGDVVNHTGSWNRNTGIGTAVWINSTTWFSGSAEWVQVPCNTVAPEFDGTLDSIR